jgi:Holliday junction resolvase-like predicted endonuclease
MFSLKRQTGNKAENLALQYLKENGLEDNRLKIVCWLLLWQGE